jgi:protoporphyrinogen oxidase
MQDIKSEKNTIVAKTSNTSNDYDYIIVGGGPTGMTLAWILGSKEKKILLLEQDEKLGGCHRVQRVDGYFSEHGPRVYSNSYLMFIELLKDMEIDFFQIFTEYNASIAKIDKKTIASLTKREKMALYYAFFRLMIDSNYGKDISIQSFMDSNKFSDASKDYIQRLCRLTDGASSENYTLFQFLQLKNQQYFYKLYQPKLPNDKGLIFLWEEKLKSTNNVTIIKNTKVTKLNKDKNKIESIICLINGVYTIFKGKKIVLTIPPKPLYHLLNGSLGVEKAFGDLKEWKSKNSYFDYIPLTFHYKNSIELPKIGGFPKTAWGIAFIILSNYIEFNDEPSKSVISVIITFTDVPNENGKTVDQCSKEEIIEYVKSQLPFFPTPDKVIISPNVIRMNDKWINLDTAYVVTTENKFIESSSKEIDNLFAVGIYNGNSNYHFTAIESAVENAIEFGKKEIPDLKYQFPPIKHLDLTEIIYNIVLIVLFIVVLYIVKKYFFVKKL